MRKYVLVVLSLLFCSTAFAETINLDAIKQIESKSNRWAYNKNSQARGLYQITPVVLDEYNHLGPEYDFRHFQENDLFIPSVNERIASWYLRERIPQMLRYYKKPETVENILISYNAGINYVVSGNPLPLETLSYIQKYYAEVYNG